MITGKSRLDGAGYTPGNDECGLQPNSNPKSQSIALVSDQEPTQRTVSYAPTPPITTPRDSQPVPRLSPAFPSSPVSARCSPLSQPPKTLNRSSPRGHFPTKSHAAGLTRTRPASRQPKRLRSWVRDYSRWASGWRSCTWRRASTPGRQSRPWSRHRARR